MSHSLTTIIHPSFPSWKHCSRFQASWARCRRVLCLHQRELCTKGAFVGQVVVSFAASAFFLPGVRTENCGIKERWYRACDLIDESERSQQLRVLYGNEYRKNKQLTSGISYLRCRLKYRLMHRKLKTNVKKQHDKLVTKGWLSCDRRLRAASLFS